MAEEIAITYETLFELLRREKGREELQKLSTTFFDDVRRYLAEKKVLAKGQEDDFSDDGQRKQLDNVRKIVKELYERREKKLVFLAINKSRTGSNAIDMSAILPEEMAFFNELLACMDRARREQLYSLFGMNGGTQASLGYPTSANSTAYIARPRFTGTSASSPDFPQPENKNAAHTEASPPVHPRRQPDESDSSHSSVEEVMTVKFLTSVPSFVGEDLKPLGPFDADETADLPRNIANILIERGRAEEVKE